MKGNDEMNKLTKILKLIFTTKTGIIATVASVVSATAVAGAIGIIYISSNSSNINNSSSENSSQSNSIVYDDNADKGGLKNKTEEEIIEELNKIVDASMINISMNLTPEFENGTSEGTLNIVNDEINIYPQIITITRKDTSEVVYKTNAIKVGSSILTDKLDIELPKGEYMCIASFMAVDETTGEKLAQANAEVKVIIKN